MLRRLLCLLLFLIIAPTLALAQEGQTRIANPANLAHAERLLGHADVRHPLDILGISKFGASPRRAYANLIRVLFNAQVTCQREAFEQAKAELRRELEQRINAVRASSTENVFPTRDDDRYARALIKLRDFIVSLQYRECFEATYQNKGERDRQERAMNDFRQAFGVERSELSTSVIRDIYEGYDWTNTPHYGFLFEKLSIYQKICDEEGFNRQKAKLSGFLVHLEADALSRAERRLARRAKDALENINFVRCDKQKQQTATAQPPASDGTTEEENSRTAGGTGQGATPESQDQTPGSQDEVPEEDRLPGLDDDFLPGAEQEEQETDKDVSFESDQTSYRVAVQAPEACVATTYTVTESTMFQTAAADQVAIVSTDDEEDQRYVAQEDVSVTSIPEGGDKLKDAPVEDTPIASTPEDDETTSDVPQDDIPVVSGDKPEEVPVEDKPDLGLVKAQETIVILALINKTDGEPVTNAATKMLPEEPPLPGSSTEIAFDSEAFFEDDVEGGFSDDDGSVQLSVATDDGAPTSDDGRDKQSQEDADKKTTAASDGNVAQADPKQPSAQTRTVTLSIDAQPREQLVAGLADDMPAVEAVSTAMDNPVIAPFVAHAFSIGTHTLLVLSVQRSEAPALKDQLKTSAIVAWFEPDLCKKKEEIDDPYFGHAGLWGQDYDDQWAIKRVGFSEEFITEAKERPDIKPVTVAVIDTGLDWYHPDLDQASIWRNESEIPDNGIDDDDNGYIDDIIGWNFINQNNRPWDYDGHGTFIAGVIAAATDNSAGIAGISPHARIMPLKALDEFGQGHASMVAEAIAYAADNGARVINLSLGGRGLTRVEKLAVEHATASGALVIVASGNSAADVSEYGPAGLDGVITVSATDQRDHQAGFSNWGEEIDISAPGVDVLSLRARNTDLLSYIRGVKYDVGAGIVGDDRAYYRASGTSFAAPIVTGAAALIMSLRPEVDAKAARRMLLNAAKDIETPGIDNFTGYGLLDIQKALASDPDFAVESRIDRVEPIKVQGKPALRLIGTADASEFDSASLALGSGKEPKNWRRLKKRIEKPVRNGVLMDLPAGAFQGSQVWTIRLITRHKNGEEREARFIVTLG